MGRGMAMKMMTTEEIKKLQLEILLQFHHFCEKHCLRYFLYAGTLLGAVRHQGFIPWDDDIDIVMPRPDYEKFFQICQKDPLGPYLRVQHYSNTEHYNAPFIKVVDTRTDGHEMHLDKDIMSGVWIDVFPLDGLPKDQTEQENYIKMLQKKIRRLELSSRPLLFCANPLRFFKRLVIYIGYHHFGYQKLARELDEITSNSYQYEDSEKVGVICFCEGQNNVVPRSIFEETKKLPFEGYMLHAPSDPDLYLTSLFGDYMTPPPPEQRISLHHYTGWWKDGFEPSNSEVNE